MSAAASLKHHAASLKLCMKVLKSLKGMKGGGGKNKERKVGYTPPYGSMASRMKSNNSDQPSLRRSMRLIEKKKPFNMKFNSRGDLVFPLRSRIPRESTAPAWDPVAMGAESLDEYKDKHPSLPFPGYDPFNQTIEGERYYPGPVVKGAPTWTFEPPPTGNGLRRRKMKKTAAKKKKGGVYTLGNDNVWYQTHNPQYGWGDAPDAAFEEFFRANPSQRGRIRNRPPPDAPFINDEDRMIEAPSHQHMHIPEMPRGERLNERNYPNDDEFPDRASKSKSGPAFLTPQVLLSTNPENKEGNGLYTQQRRLYRRRR
jgi:hypothetical protein